MAMVIAALLPMLLFVSGPAPSTAAWQGLAAAAADWPGLWGPARNGTTRDTLPPTPSTVEVLWRHAVDGGYGEVAVAGGRAYALALDDDADVLVALDAGTGRELWRLRVGPIYRGHGGSDDGPNATPAVDGGDVVVLGPHGHLVAADAATGRERWRHDLVRGFGARAPDWGFAASPLITGRLVIVPTAGERGLLAFDRATGALVWNATGTRSTSYGSAVLATLAGVPQVIAAAGDRVFAVAPGDGRLLWEAAGTGAGAEVANSPLVLPGDRVLLTAWEQSIMIRVARADGGGLAATELWRSPRLRAANAPTIYRDGHLYGFAGSQLVCLDADSGDVRWRERVGAGTLAAAGDRMLVLGDGTGELRLVRLSPDAYREEFRAPALPEGVRAVTGPSVAGGSIFLRNLREIVALRLR